MLSVRRPAVALLLAAAACSAQCAYPGCPQGTFCLPGNESQCASKQCAAVSVVDHTLECMLGTCSDGIENDYETGFDCGGGCVGCLTGSPCYIGQDCASGACGNDAINPMVRCMAASCSDHVLNGEEPDIDCGSSCCQLYSSTPALCPNLCAVGMQCVTSADCTTNRCYHLPSMGGMRFCADTLPTSVDPSLTTRIIATLRLDGQRRAFFNVSALRAALAFMLDMPLFSVLVQAVTDVPLPAEWGAYAYEGVVAFDSNHSQGTRRRRLALPAAAASSSYAHRRVQDAPDTVVPPDGVYYISTSDTAAAVDVLLSLYVMPPEAELLRDRLLAAVNGSLAILPGGWLEERVLARQQAQAQDNVRYCSTYVNASTAWDLNDTVVDCTAFVTYPSTSPSPVPPAGRRRLGSGQEGAYAAAYNGTGAPIYTLGEDTGALPRVGMHDLMAAFTPGYAWPPRIAAAGNVTFDPLGAPPDDNMVPTEVLVTTPPRGAPFAPLYSLERWAQQPVATVVDRHDRPVTSISASLSVLAGLDPDLYSPATSAVLLFGDVSQQLDAGGAARYARLLVTANASALRIWFTASWQTADGVMHAINASAPPVDVTNRPVPPPVIIPRVPFPVWAVVVLSAASVTALTAAVLSLVRRRQRRIAAAKIMDVTLVLPVPDPVEAAAAAGAKATAVAAATVLPPAAEVEEEVEVDHGIYGASFGYNFPPLVSPPPLSPVTAGAGGIGIYEEDAAGGGGAGPLRAESAEDPLPVQLLPAGVRALSMHPQPPQPDDGRGRAQQLQQQLAALRSAAAGGGGSSPAAASPALASAAAAARERGAVTMVAMPRGHAAAAAAAAGGAGASHIVPVHTLPEGAAAAAAEEEPAHAALPGGLKGLLAAEAAEAAAAAGGGGGGFVRRAAVGSPSPYGPSPGGAWASPSPFSPATAAAAAARAAASPSAGGGGGGGGRPAGARRGSVVGSTAPPPAPSQVALALAELDARLGPLDDDVDDDA